MAVLRILVTQSTESRVGTAMRSAIPETRLLQHISDISSIRESFLDRALKESCRSISVDGEPLRGGNCADLELVDAQAFSNRRVAEVSEDSRQPDLGRQQRLQALTVRASDAHCRSRP